MIVVVGLAFEARIAAGPGVRVICSGDGRNLVSSLAKAIKEARLRKMDCGGLISFGVAGGLDPELQPGTCVVGSTILCGETRTATDPVWSQRLLRKIPEAVHGPLMGVSAPVARPEDKRVLYEQTGAVAVDMEIPHCGQPGSQARYPDGGDSRHHRSRGARAAGLRRVRDAPERDDRHLGHDPVRHGAAARASRASADRSRRARGPQHAHAGRKLLGPGLGLPDFRAAELAPQ